MFVIYIMRFIEYWMRHLSILSRSEYPVHNISVCSKRLKESSELSGIRRFKYVIRLRVVSALALYSIFVQKRADGNDVFIDLLLDLF